MWKNMLDLLICVLVFQIGCASSARQITAEIQQQKAERKPFQKSSAVIKSPTKYLNRETEKGTYDPRPRVVPVDEKAGKYELRWIGYDGKQKIVKYQRADALEATVEAFIEKNTDGRFLYKYRINNFMSSPAHLSGFVVQTFASDIKDEMVPQGDDIHIGHMSSYIPGFSDGVWRRFAPLYEKSARITGGKSVVFSLVSSAIPGIV